MAEKEQKGRNNTQKENNNHVQKDQTLMKAGIRNVAETSSCNRIALIIHHVDPKEATR